MPTQLTALTEPFPTCPPIGVPPVWACSVQMARWADGSPLVDLDDAVIRDRLAPNLLAALGFTDDRASAPETAS